MAVCSYLMPDGGRCRAAPMKGEAWCYVHHPDLAEKRRAASRRGGHRGGRGRPLAELADVKRQLRELADDVVAGRVDRANAAVAGQLLGAFLRAASVEMKVKELDEIEIRIAALEAMQGEAQASAGARGAWPR